jgi:hypothetical protein
VLFGENRLTNIFWVKIITQSDFATTSLVVEN